jgi:peptidyl-prolyl cis-trans isomerase B (cyclophilin B)
MIRRLCLLGLVCLLAACGGNGGSKSAQTQTNQTQTNSSGCVTVSMPSTKARTGTKPTAPLDASKTYDVVMKTNCGSFTIRLDPKQSPNAVASFVKLTQAKYFDKTVFHRIVPDFVIQGGDPTASGTGGPGYTTVDKPPAGASYDHGVVAMAKTGAQPAGTAGSQFFVVTADNAGLTPDYAIIGNVTDGLDVVDRIGKLGDATEQPTEVVEIEQATVKTS